MKREYRYDGAGQLEAIRDMRRGSLSYRYDPVGRLLSAVSALGEESFAFDPAGNLLDDAHTRHFGVNETRGQPEHVSRIMGRPTLLDNLLKSYAGTHYSYDEYGNLTRRVRHGEKTEYRWDLFGRMVQSSGPALSVDYHYDALGRRILKQATGLSGSRAVLYGWDGDTLAWESGHAQASGRMRTKHYVYEPGGFTPLALASREGAINLHAQPVYEGRYDIDRDALWVTVPEPVAFAQIDYYQCDHLGTPQELTDSRGEIVWSAQYRAWGEAKEVISQAARKAGISNPLRFQGQYFDDETGLHYNRHRYYDPQSGRFISKDPIGLAGGINLYAYAPNLVQWIDPLGLQKTTGGVCPICPTKKPCTDIAPYWPPNKGSLGKEEIVTLQPGAKVDRYGYEGGSYVSPAGTPDGARALPPGSNEKPYNVYEVAKPIENVAKGRIAPWFGELGLGTQFKLPKSVGDLVESGHLKRGCGE
ncbi:RHS repeat-associated core domain-containing protein [Caballeronia sp. LZ029]|uniref:glycohydrolase toxin TNT-related protein n=1 Tax=Caballeronia sp. LZ029 TaxID=3038564 RepID=UPI00285D4B74|nr:glycohydrolase toxin TNT-related protein [Caballeronia sp. LZ029]MDR5746741.1 RHS repeat-associated core domain-containing protein [Caballeronia sp. LZ029]